MRTSKVWPIVAVCVAACAAPLMASAQQRANAPPPPQLEKLEEGEAPAITIRKPENTQKIIEKRDQGKVNEVKVQTGKSTYYLKPNEPAGSALPGDAESSANRAVQWKVLEFGAPRSGREAEPADILVPAPPAAAEPSKQ